ncbi:MAG: hypothetical protein U0836_16305 [Pirellulales bacterium]
MNSDHKLLSFVLPARDFGRLAEKMNVLESHCAGISDQELRWIACWHVFDPCTLDCVHCGCSRKWDLQRKPSAAERANAALLLRLREFFRRIDEPACPYNFNEVDEPDDDESVPIRVILAPVAALATTDVATSKPRLTDEQKEVAKKTLLGELEAKKPGTARQLTYAQLFGPMSGPMAQALDCTFTPDPNPLVGDLESGCICIQERRRAKTVTELARLAGKVHPLCPVCNKKRAIADHLIADMRDKFESDVLVPLEAEAAKRADRVLARIIDEPRDSLEHVIDRLSGVDAPNPGDVYCGEGFWASTDDEPHDPYPELDDPKPVFWPAPAPAPAVELCPCCGKDADCRCEHPQPPSPWE